MTGFLTQEQRDRLRNGEITEKPAMQKRIRDNLPRVIFDLRTVLRHYTLIEGDIDLRHHLDEEHTSEIVRTLVYLMDNEAVDDDLLFVLLESAEPNWTVEGVDTVHGTKQELALLGFILAFREFVDDEMAPDPRELDRWDEFLSLVDELQTV